MQLNALVAVAMNAVVLAGVIRRVSQLLHGTAALGVHKIASVWYAVKVSLSPKQKVSFLGMICTKGTGLTRRDVIRLSTQPFLSLATNFKMKLPA